MSTDRARFFVRSLAPVAALFLAILAGSAQAPSLRIVSAGPTGDLGRLADAEQVRIVFSEPMIAIGAVEATGTAPPWIRMTPAAPGSFYWSGTRTLIFSPDASTPLLFATTFTVRIDATATSAAGRVLGQPYEFTFATPAVRLLEAESYRQSGRFDSPAILVLRFNQPVRPADVLAHASVAATPHEWKPPELSPEARERLRQTDPEGLSRFDDKVAAVRRVTSSLDSVGIRLAESWDESRFPRAPDRVVIETTTAPPPDTWLTIALDESLPSPQGPRTHRAQSTVVHLEPTFFVQRMSCEGVCGPSGYNAVRLTRTVRPDVFARALTVVDTTDPLSERPVVPARRPHDEIARPLTDYHITQQMGFADQPAARTWRLQLAPNLVAADGQTLDYPWVAFVEHMHAEPFIGFAGAVWEAESGTGLPLYGRNVLSITQRIESVSRSSVMPRLLDLAKARLQWPRLHGQARRLDMRPDSLQTFAIDIRRWLSARGTGLLSAAVEPVDRLPRHASREGTPYEVVGPITELRALRALVQVTNLGVSVKDSPHSTLVFVTRLDTAAPVPGARVAIVDASNQTRWRGTTDRDGVALAPALTLRGEDAPWDLSFIVTAESGSDFAFVASNWKDESDGDPDYDLEVDASPLRGSVFTDRGVYRERETVHLKAILRNETAAGHDLLPPDAALDVTVLDSRGREIDRRTVKVNLWSSAEWTWAVPADAPLGHYQIGVSLATGAASNKPSARSSNPRSSVSGTFLVAAYRRPDFRVETTLSGDPAVQGTTLRGMVEAKYLFGGSLGARPVQWSLTRLPVQNAPGAVRERYPQSRYEIGYLPTDDDPRQLRVPLLQKTEFLAADGRLRLPLPTASENDLAYSYTLESDVEDASGQHIANRASLVVHPASLYVAVSRPPMFVETTTGANVGIAAVDLSGRPVSGVSVVVSLRRVQWVQGASNRMGRSDWERREIAVGEWTVVTSESDRALSIPVHEGGSFVLRATARDAAGFPTRTDVPLFALGQGVSSWSSDGKRIDLTPERQTWKPGETARILIHSPWQRATGLVTVEREGIRSHRTFVVSSTQDAVEVPITAADVPNIYVSVLLVKGRTAEELTANGTDAGEPSYRVGYTELSVDDSSKRLRVDVSADRQEYLPRQPLTVSVAVSGADGKAAPAEVTLWAVDHGLLSLTNYKTPDVVKAIYLRKALQVMTVDNRQRLMSRRPTGEFGGILGGVMGGMVGDTGFDVQASMSRLALVGSPQTRPLDTEVRQDFRPLVFWLGSATTDADGRTTTTVTLPDSLTTYRIMAVAGKRASQFGFGEHEVRVAKPLTLLTAFPRFLNQGDRASFGGVVTNSGKEGGTAAVTIESLAPDILHFDGSAAQTLKIAAGASIPVRFSAVVPGSGSARVRMVVTLGSERDAIEMPLDVARPMRLETTAAYGETVGTATENIALPAGLVSSSGGLTVELASSALVGLGEAARYLDEYRYGCAEQKASRALALLLGSDLGGAFKLASVKPEEYRAAGTRALTDLYSYQCYQGGFSLWRGKCDSVSVYLTAYVLHTMKVAETLKVDLDREVVDRALDYLEGKLDGPPSQVEWWPVWGASQAYAVRVLAEFGRKPTDQIGRLVAEADRLPIFALSNLADALAASNDRGPRYRDVVRRLANTLRIEADRAHVEEVDDDALGWLWNSNVRATAVVLDGLSRRKDDPALVAPLVRWLLAARQNGRWDTTHENAMVLEALVAYYRAFESEVPRMTTTVSVGDRTIGTAAFNGRSTTAQQVVMAMPALAAALASTTAPTLSISRSGTGRVYYTARMQSLAPEPPEALDRGFRVERRYEPYVKDGAAPASTSFSAGDLVRVTVAVTVRGEGRFLALTDPLPAGFEPIDALLDTTARDVAIEATRGSDDDDWWAWWRRGGFDHVEKHDDRVLAFATRLGSGRHEFSYLARATTAGTFGVGGARLEAMYAPELEGKSQSATVTVK